MWVVSVKIFAGVYGHKAISKFKQQQYVTYFPTKLEWQEAHVG